MLKLLSKREKIILSAAIGTVTFALLFNFALAPMLAKNANLSKEISITRARLKKYQRLLNRKEYIQNRYSKFSLRPQPANAKDALVDALSELESLAKAAGISIIDIRPQDLSAGSVSSKEVSVNLRTEGEIEGLLKFIYDIENSPSLLWIKRFQLNTRPNTQTLEGIFLIAQSLSD